MTRLHPYNKEDFLFGVELEWQRFNGQRGQDTYREEDEDGEVTLPFCVGGLSINGMTYVGQQLWNLTPSLGDIVTVDGIQLQHRGYGHMVNVRRVGETEWSDCTWTRNILFHQIHVESVAALMPDPEQFRMVLRQYQEDAECGDNTLSHVDGIVPTDLDSGSDATVSGGEIRCAGPKGYIRTIDAFTSLFSLGEWGIDEECSCHIHLSVRNKQHEYGTHLHKWMIVYLIDNMRRVPRCVLPRWTMSSWMRQYYKIPDESEAQDSRYNFIAFRELGGEDDDDDDSPNNTWEFRCWGNISNAADLATCMDLSMEAYNFAYDKCHRQKMRCNLPWGTIRTLFKDVLQSTTNTQRESA